MGTIVTKQAGHTYNVIPSNIGMRVEYHRSDGTIEEILVHRPADEPVNRPPIAGDMTFPEQSNG